jgi:hypothetical protein
MTKSQEPQQANWKVVKAKHTTYTTFYLILLILLTISSVFGLFSLGTIDNTIASINTQPGVAYITFAQQALAIVMAVGLIFLYKKDKRGLNIILAGYGAAIIFSLLFLFFKDPLVQETAKKIVEGGKGDVASDLAEQIANTIFTIVPIANIVASALFGTLWYFAWKKQTTYDSSADVKKSDI